MSLVFVEGYQGGNRVRARGDMGPFKRGERRERFRRGSGWRQIVDHPSTTDWEGCGFPLSWFPHDLDPTLVLVLIRGRLPFACHIRTPL